MKGRVIASLCSTYDTEDNMKKNKSFKKIWVIILALAIGLALAFYGFIISWGSPLDKGNKAEILVEIPEGASTHEIGSILEKKKVIKDGNKFKYYSKFKNFDGQYKSGTYALSPSMSMEDIAKTMAEGKTADSGITIPEGYTIEQIGALLEERGITSKSDFIEATENINYDYKFLKDVPTGTNRLSGFLFPDTYAIPKNSSPEKIVNIFLKNFNKKFTEEFYQEARNRKMSIEEVLTVASIVERETQKDDERGKVASVIYNRLKIDMPLQMCSTVQYILGESKALLSESDVQIDSPYNTYTNGGLPPRPICNPGIASIKAALNPDKTDYLYFVVSEKLDGSQNFSKDYEIFEKDKEAYYKAYTKKHQQ